MKISSMIAVAWTVLAVLAVPAVSLAQGLAPRTPKAQTPGGESVVAPTITPGATPLTVAECKKLGGKVASVSVCAGLGNPACVTTDQFGKTHAVCIKVVIGPLNPGKKDGGSSRTTSPRGSRPTAPAADVAVAPLTSQECEGLGGKVISTNSCNAKGQKACSTVDVHGVVRVACIDKVAK